jgi:hypothetical protein
VNTSKREARPGQAYQTLRLGDTAAIQNLMLRSQHSQAIDHMITTPVSGHHEI